MRFNRRPQYQTGDVVQLMPGSIEPASLAGAMVRIVRRSRRTGAFTVQFVAAAGPYNKGDTLVVGPYQVHSAIITR
jgi:hypothetical protein